MTGPAADGSGCVVVIDDHEPNLILVRRVLAQRPGLRVVTETDGERGLDLVRRELPALAIVDLNIPGTDGETIVRQLRRDAATATIPTIVLSGDANPETRQRLLAAGAADFVAKPFVLDDLLQRVDRLIDGRTSAGERPAP